MNPQSKKNNQSYYFNQWLKRLQNKFNKKKIKIKISHQYWNKLI